MSGVGGANILEGAAEGLSDGRTRLPVGDDAGAAPDDGGLGGGISGGAAGAASVSDSPCRTA